MSIARSIGIAQLVVAVASTAAMAVPPVVSPWVMVASDSAAYDAAATAVDLLGSEFAMGVRGRDDGLTNRGAVYIFRNGTVGWAQTQKLTPLGPHSHEEFGHAVSLSGEFLAIGAPRSNRDGSEAGSAWVFQSNGISWGEIMRLRSPNAVAQGAFGSAVCIDTDGAQTRLVVGASGEQLGGVKSGRAYVFRQSGDEWVLEASLQPDGIPTDNDGFGRTVSIRSDWAFVGAAFEDSAAVNGGAVFVYRRAESGWVLWQKLTSPNPTALGEYGASLGFDGQTLVVGAPRESTGGVVEGCVHVLRFDGAEWVEVAILRSPSPVALGEFGCSVDIDGGAVIVGAQREASARGHCVLYREMESGWIPVASLEALRAGVDSFAGASVAISGLRVVAGAPLGGEAHPYQGMAFGADFSTDCDDDLVPDIAEIAGGQPDCDGNGVPDACDISAGAPDRDGNGVPDACEVVECSADITGNGLVNAADLAELLAAWGAVGIGLPTDLSGDGIVGGPDLAMLLDSWGACP